jgi:hypothetical protein
MKTKTFKIGEYCKGGVITVNVDKKQTTIIGKNWDVSAGTNKNSNQSNAKEWARWTIPNNDSMFKNNLSNVLYDLTTHYYSEQIINWIDSQIPKTM